MAWVQSPVASTSTSTSVSVSPTSPTFGLHSLSLTVPTSLSAHLAPPPGHQQQRYHSPQQQHHHLPQQHQQQRVPRPPAGAAAVYSAMAPPPVPPSNRKRKSYTDVRSSASPAPESSASPSSHAEEGDSEYDPSRLHNAQRAPVRAKRAIQAKPAPAPAAPPAQAQKIGPGGRPMSREQLRKANHSLIERRRREKINAALSDLREMVPGLGSEGTGGKGGEFKLEVLERTVEHMRELKAQVEDMQSRLSGLSSAGPKAYKKRRPSHDDDVDMDDHDDSPPRRPAHTPVQPQHGGSYMARKPAASSTPPSPSVTPPLHHTTVLSSPDPNETEPEFDLPPPLTMASKRVSQDDTSSSARTASPHPPSIASLLASSAQSQRSSAGASTTRPSAGPSPNIYLPFPTPSPTSPFLTYHPSSASTASSTTGPPEPSPFMAPLQNISLFGGALDSSASPYEGPTSGKQPSPPDLVMPPPSSANGRDMAPEEAANLLLAISSPDTLHPTRTGTTPLMSAVSGRSRALESEDFTLDGGVATATHRTTVKIEHGQKYRPQGKTARDILRM